MINVEFVEEYTKLEKDGSWTIEPSIENFRETHRANNIEEAIKYIKEKIKTYGLKMSDLDIGSNFNDMQVNTTGKDYETGEEVGVTLWFWLTEENKIDVKNIRVV